MIIEFTVTNFRSIRDEQTVSFYAESSPHILADNIVYPSSSKIGVLKTAGFYGANASGKSNILLAFEALRFIVGQSGDLKDNGTIPCYEPYRLAKALESAPVQFEIEFVVPSGVRYLYWVSFSRHKIVGEKLISYKSGQPATYFERTESDDWKSISFGATFTGGKKRIPFFAANAYLSKAGNSADAPASIREIFQYFSDRLVHIAHDDAIYLTNNWQENSQQVSSVGALLNFADTGINQFDARKQEFNSEKLNSEIPQSIRGALAQRLSWKYTFTHSTEDGSLAAFELKDESEGTRRWFNLAPVVLEALRTGWVVILDEIESSMHPFMTEMLIKLFNDPEANRGNAQLIFSSHDVHLLESKQFRRDQILFAEKVDGASRFYTAADYDKSVVKSSSPFAKWYLEGRFDAVPHIHYRKIVELIKSNRSSDAQKEKKESDC